MSLDIVRAPTFTLKWATKDVTNDIKSFVQSIQYVDNLEGQSDTIEIVLDNPSLLFCGAWLPTISDKLELTLGYLGEAQSGVIVFQLDKIVNNTLTCTIHGLATPTDVSLRQVNTVAYENTTLEQIAQVIAKRNNLTLIGKIKAIPIKRVTQTQETDLEFLKKIASDYGAIFKVEGTTKLVFYDENALQKAAVTLTISYFQLQSFEIEEGQQTTFAGSNLAYQDPNSGTLITGATDANPIAPTKADKLIATKQVEDAGQASMQATETLRQANQGLISAKLELEGMPELASGVNFSLTDIGQYSGDFQVRSITHSLTRSEGYRSQMDVIRLSPVTRS